MLTNKKRFERQMRFLLLALVIGFLAGCTPPGPRALLKGKRLLDEGRFAEAVDELKIATSILTTNAQAWNFFGLALHHSGQYPNATEAYQKALKLNPDLIVAHYNFGCMLLEENRQDTLEGARNELTAYTLHQGNSLDGWLKLGTVNLRLNDLYGAENSFKEALRLDPENAEALNDLGMIQLRRHRQRDAATYFNSALKLHPDYGAALLNLASTEVYLNNKTLALQKYREYLALKPRPANWDAVNSLQSQLDQELNPTHALNVVAVASNNILTNLPRNTPAISNPPKPEIVSTPARSNNVSSQPFRTESVQLPDAPPLKVANPGLSQPLADDSSRGNETTDTSKNDKNERRGFFQKLNPFTLFRSHPKTTNSSSQVVVAPDATARVPSTTEELPPAPKLNPEKPKPVAISRYPYLPAGQPPTGNRQQADKYLGQASEAVRNNRSKDAVSLYRAAAQADPAYLDAELALGAAAYNDGDLPLALRAYELALAIKPDSFKTRFNFALTLKRANYFIDAANELENLLNVYASGETPERVAAVHLTLANLYADQFHQTALARIHYQKVLALDPHNPQETTIRYWLQDNS